jgi:DNA-binding NarL/FixJ family response regulator
MLAVEQAWFGGLMKRGTSPHEPIRVLLVDDHEVVVTGIRAVLRLIPDIRVVGEAGTAAAAVNEATRLMPDLVLLDIRLPDRSGIEACRDILSAVPGTRVLFLTSYADEDTVLAAVLAGAQGYVLKDIRTDALVDAIRGVAAGKSLLDPIVTKKTMTWLKTMATKGPRSRLDVLSPQEERMLPMVAQGKTNKEIATAMNLSEKTVKNYLCRVYEKLQVSRRSQVAALYVQHARSRNHSGERSP